MEDRERIINDIGCCISHGLDACKYCSKYDPTDIKLDCMDRLFRDAMESLKEEPEIVRCKDCRKKDKEECPMYVDYPCTNKPGDDWFCAEGAKS